MTLLTKTIELQRKNKPVRIRCIHSNSDRFTKGEIYTGKINLISGKNVEVAVRLPIDDKGKKGVFNVIMSKYKVSRYGKFRFVLDGELT